MNVRLGGRAVAGSGDGTGRDGRRASIQTSVGATGLDDDRERVLGRTGRVGDSDDQH